MATLIISVISTRTAPAWDTLPSRSDDEPGFSFSSSPADWRTVNMYQIVTDRFNDGDSSNNNWQGYYNDSDGHMYHGGDFQGIEDKLDYLQTMGVKAIWISPVQVQIDHTSDIFGNSYAPYHGYQSIGLNRLNGYFGDLTALRSLVDQAHARGIYVILDIVVNHMADLMGSQNSNNSVYHTFEYNDPWWHHGYTHDAPFDDINRFHRNGAIQNYDDPNQYIRGELSGGLDDFRTENNGVKQDLATTYKALISATDCDGFRIDAVKHVEHAFWDFFLPEIYNHAASLGKNNFLCFGEVFSGDDSFVGSYTGTTRHNSMLYFPMMDTMESVFAQGSSTENLTTRLNALSSYHQDARYQLVNFLDNHDTDRSLAGSKMADDWDKLRVALTFMYTSQQIPCIYYGTEQGFNGGDDPWNREDMFDGGWEFGPSDGDNFNMGHALFQHIQSLNNFRETYPSLTLGSYQTRWETSFGPSLFAYTKTLNEEVALVVLNTDGGSQSCTPATGAAQGDSFVNLWDSNDVLTVDGSGNVSVSIGGKSSKIYVLAGAASEVQISPAVPVGCGDVSITYLPGTGPLKDASQIYVFTGHDGWLDVITPSPAMTQVAETWTYTYTPSQGVEVVNFVFNDGGSIWDNSDGDDWSFLIQNCAGSFAVAEASPVVNATSGAQNNVGDQFDFDREGGHAQTTYQGGFGSFGQLHINYDATNLYIGARGCDVAGGNNAMVIFMGINTIPDAESVETLWNVSDPSGEPQGLEQLHNVLFNSRMSTAIVLGDEWGDDSWPDFNLESGYSYGQGIYYLAETGPSSGFASIPGATLSQFDGLGESATSSDDDDTDRLVDRWEARIPWNALNASNGIFSVTNLYVAGLMTSGDTNGNDRYLSANFLGDSATSASELDGFGNFGFGFVTVEPTSADLPPPDSDADGLRDGWEMDYFGDLTTGTASSDWDNDGSKDVDESRAGTSPKDASSIFRATSTEVSGDSVVIRWSSVVGHQYTLHRGTDVMLQDFTEVQSGITATPPQNSYTDTVPSEVGIYMIEVE